MNQRTERWKKQHCHDCDASVTGTAFRCSDCKQKRAEEKRKREQRHEKDGQCRKCGQPRLEKYKVCLVCAVRKQPDLLKLVGAERLMSEEEMDQKKDDTEYLTKFGRDLCRNCEEKMKRSDRVCKNCGSMRQRLRPGPFPKQTILIEDFVTALERLKKNPWGLRPKLKRKRKKK